MVTNQAKAGFIAAHFSNKMATEKLEKHALNATPLCNLPPDNIVVAENVVARYLSNVNTRKAPELDAVSPFLLNLYAWELSKHLIHIFQHLAHYIEGGPCHACTHTKKSMLDPSNYRPILMLPVVNKNLERVIAEQLTLNSISISSPHANTG